MCWALKRLKGVGEEMPILVQGVKIILILVQRGLEKSTGAGISKMVHGGGKVEKKIPPHFLME